MIRIPSDTVQGAAATNIGFFSSSFLFFSFLLHFLLFFLFVFSFSVFFFTCFLFENRCGMQPLENMPSNLPDAFHQLINPFNPPPPSHSSFVIFFFFLVLFFRYVRVGNRFDTLSGYQRCLFLPCHRCTNPSIRPFLPFPEDQTHQQLKFYILCNTIILLANVPSYPCMNGHDLGRTKRKRRRRNIQTLLPQSLSPNPRKSGASARNPPLGTLDNLPRRQHDLTKFPPLPW